MCFRLQDDPAKTVIDSTSALRLACARQEASAGGSARVLRVEVVDRQPQQEQPQQQQAQQEIPSSLSAGDAEKVAAVAAAAATQQSGKSEATSATASTSSQQPQSQDSSAAAAAAAATSVPELQPFLNLLGSIGPDVKNFMNSLAQAITQRSNATSNEEASVTTSATAADSGASMENEANNNNNNTNNNNNNNNNNYNSNGSSSSKSACASAFEQRRAELEHALRESKQAMRTEFEQRRVELANALRESELAERVRQSLELLRSSQFLNSDACRAHARALLDDARPLLSAPLAVQEAFVQLVRGVVGSERGGQVKRPARCKQPAQLTDAGEAVVHNAVCDVCKAAIRGVRYKCANCADYDLCVACEAAHAVTQQPGASVAQEGDEHDHTHVFLKIHTPLPPPWRRPTMRLPNAYRAGPQADATTASPKKKIPLMKKKKDATVPVPPPSTPAQVTSAPSSAAAATTSPRTHGAPVCGSGHALSMSLYAGGAYRHGWVCDVCAKHGVGERYHCAQCTYDLCKTCATKRLLASASAADAAAVANSVRAGAHVCGTARTAAPLNVLLAAKPVSVQYHTTSGAHKSNNNNNKSSSSAAAANCGTLFARFVSESVPDGTILPVGAHFTKTWTLRNSGTCAWPADCHLVHVGGDVLGANVSAPQLLPSVDVNDEITVAVPMTAPALPGRYVSYWRMQAPGGAFRFGHRVWADVIVVTPRAEESDEEASSAVEASETVRGAGNGDSSATRANDACAVEVVVEDEHLYPTVKISAAQQQAMDAAAREESERERAAATRVTCPLCFSVFGNDEQFAAHVGDKHADEDLPSPVAVAVKKSDVTVEDDMSDEDCSGSATTASEDELEVKRTPSAQPQQQQQQQHQQQQSTQSDSSQYVAFEEEAAVQAGEDRIAPVELIEGDDDAQKPAAATASEEVLVKSASSSTDDIERSFVDVVDTAVETENEKPQASDENAEREHAEETFAYSAQLNQLMMMGFNTDASKLALITHNGDLMEAVRSLLAQQDD